MFLSDAVGSLWTPLSRSERGSPLSTTDFTCSSGTTPSEVEGVFGSSVCTSGPLNSMSGTSAVVCSLDTLSAPPIAMPSVPPPPPIDNPRVLLSMLLSKTESWSMLESIGWEGAISLANSVSPSEADSVSRRNVLKSNLWNQCMKSYPQQSGTIDSWSR